jgi:hypothetical protein
MRDVYGLNLQIENNLKELNETKKREKGLSVMQWAFTVATFAIYFSFTSVIFGGVSVWGLQEYLFKNSTNTIALVWVVIVIFVVPLALSLGKHFNYQAISDSTINRQRAALIIHSMIGLALISGIYYEAISSSANLQAKAFNAVDYKGNLAAIMNSGSAVNVDTGLSGDLVKAETKLAQCLDRLSKGKEPHCNGSQAAVNSLKNQISAASKASADSSANAVSAKGDVLKEAVNDQSLPASKWFAETFGLSNDGGTMMIVIIAALFFELIHLTTVFSEIRTLIKLKELKQMGEHLQNQYFNTLGKVYSPNDFNDDNTKLDLNGFRPDHVEAKPFNYDIKTKGKPFKDTEEKSDFGFIPQNKFKYQEHDEPLNAVSSKSSFGFIPAGKKSESPTLSLKESTPTATLKSDRQRLKEGEKIYPQGGLDEKINDFGRMLKIFESQPESGVAECPVCSKQFTKSCVTHRFCSAQHRTRYWNVRRNYVG